MEIKKEIIRFYYKSSYSRKLQNLDKIDNFLDKYQVPNLKEDQINHIIFSQPKKKKKAQDQIGLGKNSIQPS